MSVADKLATIAANEKRVHEAGIEQGKQAEYDRFWDAYQENGKRNFYQHGFANQGWTDETFKPKYDLILGNGYSGNEMFKFSKITNIAESLEKCGVVLDTSKNFYFSSMLNGSVTTRMPVINCTGVLANNTSCLQYMFLNAKAKTIDKMIVPEWAIFYNTFNNAADLENIIFEGTIGQNGLNLQWSTKLSKASIESIVGCLSTTTSGLSITLSKTAVNNAFTTDEWTALEQTRPNWTISLV